MATPQGYQCEFMDQVGEDFYCKKCNLVARRLTITSCCAESFCQACIAGVKDKCPVCEEKEFSTVQHSKNQKRISNLKVYCTMKERGCGWSGTLDQLDTHLDPDQDKCQYVDTKCHLGCTQTIPKNKMDQHVSEECVKREYFCQYCSFKATYEEVVDKHLPECVYVPLDCPNMCGVTFERDFMEDHMKMCRLKKIECEFSMVGCKDRIRREDQEEHSRQNSRKHLTLTALLAVGTKEELQEKILEQDKKIEEFEKKLEDKERQLENMKKEVNKERKFMKQKMDEQNKKIEQNFDLILSNLKGTLLDLKNKSDENERKLTTLSKMLPNRYFEMKNFTKEKVKDLASDWKSPAMYTHVCGYKFCIGVHANGWGSGQGKAIFLRLFAMPGDYDKTLKWPTRAKFTVELINKRGGANVSGGTLATSWSQVVKTTHLSDIVNEKCRLGFIEHSKLADYLVQDTLHFLVSSVEFL